MNHVLCSIAAVLGLLVCTLLPFAPGRHDVCAIALSTVAQALAWAWLMLVPLGVLWFAHGLRYRLDLPAADRVRHRYTLAAIVVCTVLGLVGALITVTQAGISLAVGLAVATLAFARQALRRSQERTRSHPGTDRAAAICCVVAPIVLLLLQRAAAVPATEFARDRAIANSAALIADIESYRASRGHYPLSLHSIWEDYPPAVIGVSRYQYEPQGDACNLFFEMPTFDFGARVVVMWNPRDEHVMTSHNMDLLRRSPADLERRRGFFASHAAPQPHWRWFVFD